MTSPDAGTFGRYNAGMIEYIIRGAVHGLNSGLVPSPLMAFVVSQSLSYGPGEGMKASIASFFTSVPIVLTNLFVLSCISCFKPVLGAISRLGVAMFVMALLPRDALGLFGVIPGR